jgi:hypothetical protein
MKPKSVPAFGSMIDELNQPGGVIAVRLSTEIMNAIQKQAAASGISLSEAARLSIIRDLQREFAAPRRLK